MSLIEIPIFKTELDTPRTQYLLQPNINEIQISRRLKDLCVEMDATVIRATTKFETCLEHQRSRFFKAFKSVVEQVLEEFVDLQKKFEEYTSFYEKDSQQQSVQDKLVFFRTECESQQLLSTQQKQENQSLRAQLEQLKSDNLSQYNVMMKQGNDKLLLQQKLLDVQTLFQQQKNCLTFTSENSRFSVRQSRDQADDSINRKYGSFQLQKQQRQVKQRLQSQNLDQKPQSRNERNATPRTVFVYKDENQKKNELLQLWGECVEETKKQVRRGLYQDLDQSNDYILGLNSVDKISALGLFIKSHQKLNSIIFKNQRCCNHQLCPMNLDRKEQKSFRKNYSLSFNTDVNFQNQNEAKQVFMQEKVFDAIVNTRLSGTPKNSMNPRKYIQSYTSVDQKATPKGYQTSSPQEVQNPKHSGYVYDPQFKIPTNQNRHSQNTR